MYRPLRFCEVTGQQIILKLIQKSLIAQKLPRTIILHGPSGVGKTTIARLIAAWFVCENKSEDDVCGKCNMCLSVQSDSLVDILEFDAASNTSVEDMREILNQCNYAPQYGSEKIFIIDEAHMLSRNAITALLKILEETAQHIRFILLTTEIDKIPNPIRSRCLCLQMQQIGQDDMRIHLADLNNTGNTKIDPDAADLIIKLSGGSLREALSIVEQMKLLNEHITLQLIHETMAFCPNDELTAIAGDLFSGNFMKMYDTLIQAKFALPMLVLQLIHHFQDILGSKSEANREKALKILVDLNKLHLTAQKNTFFSAVITIGLVEIAHAHSA